MNKIQYCYARSPIPSLVDKWSLLVGKTSVFKEIMETHSLYFSGGDAEMGILARMMKKKIGFIDFKVFTAVPETLGKWFKQRMDSFWWHF